MFYFRIRTVTLNLPLLTTTVRLSLRRSSDVSGGRGRAPGGGKGGRGGHLNLATTIMVRIIYLMLNYIHRTIKPVFPGENTLMSGSIGWHN